MWKDWLALSKREQKGFIVLSVLLFALIIFYFLIPVIFSSDDQNKFGSDSLLVQWIDSVNAVNADSVKKKNDLFYFDPNSISVSDLEKLGVRGDALINWLKLRESGHKFKIADDLFNIYSLDSTLAAELIPYVKFSKDAVKSKTKRNRYSGTEKSVAITEADKTNYHKKSEGKIRRDTFVIDINVADTAEFAVLNGIGSVLSARIVSYRKALGGFYDVEQLKEVYGMPASVIDDNKDHLKADTITIRKINVNKASLRRLKNHPYIDFYLAKAIVEYRKKNDSIKSIDEILILKEVKPGLSKKLAEYLCVE